MAAESAPIRPGQLRAEDTPVDTRRPSGLKTTRGPTRILVIDHHRSFRQLLIFRLACEPTMLVVGQAGPDADARAALHASLVGPGIDVVTVELLGRDNGCDLIREIRTRVSDAAVLVVSASDDPESLAAAVEAGAAGLIHKGQSQDEIIAAIRTLGAGEPLITPNELGHWLRLAAEIRDRDRVARNALAKLSRREREVLQLLAAGHSDRDIVEDLAISYETVRSHLANILGKLGVESRLQAVIYAARHGAVAIR